MLKLINIGLLFIVVSTALAVVYTKHENRVLYTKLRELQKQHDALDVDWGRLQLEQSTLAAHGRVEELARHRLAMRNVDYTEAVIVQP